MEEKIRAHIFVSGKVQGVFFRENTQKKAQTLEITGWVRNLEDSRVEAVFEGEKEKVEKMVNWAKRGPLFARVNDLEVEWEEYKGEFEDFEIKY
ncbi:MAG: acylphosphatase [Candidatus Paceibacterales bacterium]